MTTRKNKKIFIFSLAFFLFAFGYLAVFGAPSKNFQYTCEQFKYPWCNVNTGSLASLVSQFYTMALGVAGAAAFGMFIYGAIVYTTSGVVGKKQEAMEIIKGAIFGVLLLLGAYLLLLTINPDLVDLGRIEDELSESAPKVTVRTTSTVSEFVDDVESYGSTGGAVGEYSQPIYSNQLTRIRLFDNGVTALRSCKDGSSSGCVSFDGIRKETVDEMVALREQFGQTYTITSGTEGNHAGGLNSHSGGYKFDVRPEPSLNDWIRGNFTQVGQRRDSVTGKFETIYKNPQTGAEYVFEPEAPGRGAHWDVVVRTNS